MKKEKINTMLDYIEKTQFVRGEFSNKLGERQLKMQQDFIEEVLKKSKRRRNTEKYLILLVIILTILYILK